MIVCGIEIIGKKAIFVLLESGIDEINDITGKFSQLVLNNDENCEEVRSFSETINSHFDNYNPDRIAIIKRNKSGPYASSPISFKLEGLIQSYSKINIELVSPNTLRKFERDNNPIINTKYKYQSGAYLLALYLLG